MIAGVQLNQRVVTAVLLHARHKVSDIISETGYAPRTVYGMASNLRQNKASKGWLAAIEVIEFI